ncbi:MAG: HlyC/CorC family transporter [Deltaproteobacteria bacterium]|nr:HlyC/CorC family transporter [Deltaproteobacteria bacterium]
MLALFTAILCVFANAFFVAAEFAIARVRPTALKTRAEQGDAQAKRALRMLTQIDAYLTATQLGVTLASLGLGWLGEPALSRYIEPPLTAIGLSSDTVHGIALVAAFAVISLLHIVVGELVPKSLAILRPAAVTRFTVQPLTAFFYLMYPVLYVLNGISVALLRGAGLEPGTGSEIRLSAEELRLIVRASFQDDERQGTKRELIERVLRATDKPVRSIMVPRVDMVTLSLDKELKDWIETIRTSGFSRYPMAEGGNPDKIVGYLYAKDMLLAESHPKQGIRALKRDVFFIPEHCSVGDLLTKFQRTGIPLAIVVDEYGGTSGLVTVKDVVQELVGDLRDELVANDPRFEVRENGTVVADGSLPIAETPLDSMSSEIANSGDTIGGFIISRLGRLARPGDQVRIGKYEVIVEDVRRRRIGRVVFRPWTPTVPPPETPDGILS